MANQQVELDLQTMTTHHCHLGLVEHILRFLQINLTTHIFEQDDHKAHEYHATLQYSPKQDALTPVWHYDYSQLLFTHAKAYNWRLGILYNWMWQIAPLELPPRADHTEMIHFLRFPFFQIPPDDMLHIIDTATQQNPACQPVHNDPQPVHNDPPHQDQEQPGQEWSSTIGSALTPDLP